MLLEAIGAPTPLKKALEVAPTIKRTVKGVLAELGILIISEDIEPETQRDIRVTLKEVGNEYNMYEVAIPISTKGGKSYLHTYQLYSNKKGKDEDDEDATKRIIEGLKKYVRNEISKFNKAKQEGKLETARKIITDLVVDEKSAAYELKTLNIKQPTYSKEQIGKIEKLSKASSSSRDKFLHSVGLLSRSDISTQLGIGSADSLTQFVVAEIQHLAKSTRGWAELGSVSISADDIDKFLPVAKMDLGLTGFVKKAGINENRLSLDAVEAITAAALAVSAGIMAANKKIEASYAVR